MLILITIHHPNSLRDPPQNPSIGAPPSAAKTHRRTLGPAEHRSSSSSIRGFLLLSPSAAAPPISSRPESYNPLTSISIHLRRRRSLLLRSALLSVILKATSAHAILHPICEYILISDCFYCLLLMAREPSPEIDDELFNEVYGKVYTGPLGSTSNNAEVKANASKRSLPNDQSDEENLAPDPNAVPTDFTSREAKVWEAKAKAIERNWKKRKEEEMICKLCGESGHFTQGCPSTLGANRKSADFFERVPARDKNIRALFSDKVISQIEKDVGCKLRMDEKFLFVSGKDRLILAKGVDAVHKMIQENKDKNKSPSRSESRSGRARSRSPDRSPVGSHLRCSDSQKSRSSTGNTTHLHSRGYEDTVREDLQKLSRGSSEGRAYTNDGAKGHPVRSKSPIRPTYGGNSFSSYDGQNLNSDMHKRTGWDVGKSGMDSLFEHKSDDPAYPQTLEGLEMEFKRELMEIGRVRDQEEDEENHKHREHIRDLRENYIKRLGTMRGIHAIQWQVSQPTSLQRQSQLSMHNVYNQPAYPDYDQASKNSQYGGRSLSIDSRNRYPYPGENYQASRPEAYAEFQHQRRDEFGAPYGRY